MQIVYCLLHIHIQSEGNGYIFSFHIFKVSHETSRILNTAKKRTVTIVSNDCGKNCYINHYQNKRLKNTFDIPIKMPKQLRNFYLLTTAGKLECVIKGQIQLYVDLQL